VDRWDRHRVLLATQVLSLVQSTALAAVAFTAGPGTSAVWLIAVLNLFQGAVNAFDMPARQALLVEMVSRREDLPNAIALNSSLVNGSRLVGGDALVRRRAFVQCPGPARRPEPRRCEPDSPVPPC
jgi:MFS family permease